MNYRHESRQALKRARTALESNDAENLKYVALELRMAMESLTYDRAKAYKDEFPPDEYETWQPRKVMAVLLEIDATADKDSTLSYGIEETPGQPASQMTMLGTETVLNMETLRKHYDALGSFLHVPTLKQTKSGPFKTVGSGRLEQGWCKADESRNVARDRLLWRFIFRSVRQISVQHGCPDF